LLKRLLTTAASLETLSDRGRVVPERDDPAIRELLVEPYRLVYSVATDDVVILGLIHQRQDYERWRDAR
jgi:toxin ParE1/3/4